MQAINKKTNIDITKYVLLLLEGKITQKEFESKTKLKKWNSKIKQSKKREECKLLSYIVAKQ